MRRTLIVFSVLFFSSASFAQESPCPGCAGGPPLEIVIPGTGYSSYAQVFPPGCCQSQYAVVFPPGFGYSSYGRIIPTPGVGCGGPLPCAGPLPMVPLMAETIPAPTPAAPPER